MARSLFITYDGLTDPLGQSQILPYMAGLSRKGHQIHILSCEKEKLFEKNRGLIEKICKDSGIGWTPLRFHKKPPVLAKYYDLYNLNKTASMLHRNHSFNIIHCRSYLSADIGRNLKRKTGVKYLFDMRSFWVDERVEGGLWNTNYYFYRKAYQHWKKKEAQLIADADHIISLTEAGKKEILQWPSYKGAPITVIPCSTDMELFNPGTGEQKQQAREKLQLPRDGFVLSYLGSLGTWYMLDEMLFLFKLIKEANAGSRFLILTPDDPEKVYSAISKFELKKEDFVIRFASRSELPFLLQVSDASVSFIKPVYSKIGSSPTKLGELLAMGIPVICNDIGDVGKIINQTGGGIVVPDFERASLQKAVEYIRSLNGTVPIERQNVIDYYSLSGAVSRYEQVYQNLSAIS
jgi:glycosyltransferase involved in cell wall biosynthesis